MRFWALLSKVPWINHATYCGQCTLKTASFVIVLSLPKPLKMLVQRSRRITEQGRD
jgi:hypothetical protein